VTATRRIGLVEDPRYRAHRSPPGHPERPERLEAVGQALAAHAGALTPVPARPAEDDELLLVHERQHLGRLAEVARVAPAHLDPDTYVSPVSHEVARLAAGATIDLACAVARGELDAGFAAVRPPGHHAEAHRAMGFCLLNNVAIAARALQQREGVGKVLILDWDVHHGNGTQHAFEEDPSILYFSAHQFPYYPGTGDANEAGRGRGEGATVNVPMPAGCGDTEYVGMLRRILVPVARRFAPDLVLVSCGFDAHRDDPLASMEVTRAGYAELARTVRRLADELCGGRWVAVLEGGYAPSGLYEGTSALLEALLAAETPTLAPLPDAPRGSTLAYVLGPVAAVHRRFVPEVGSE